MAKWRYIFLLLVCSSALFGRSRTDYSGTFARTGVADIPSKGKHAPSSETSPPLTLQVQQTANWLRVTTIQNWASSVSRYRLNGKPSDNVDHDGFHTTDRLKLKNQELLIKTELLLSADYSFPISRTWKLSPDLQTLTMEHVAHAPGYKAVGYTETFARKPSLEVALEQAEAISEMNRCNVAPSTEFAVNKPTQYDGAAPLGFTGFQQLGRYVSFYASLDGPFFRGLVRVDKPDGPEFYKGSQLVKTFTNEFVLEIEPRLTKTFDWFEIGSGAAGVPEEFRTLRFHLRWKGADSRDLGEVPSKMEALQLTLPLAPPPEWHILKVPTDNVPLTDDLEIRILSSTGQQLGCISGHI